MHLSDYEDQMKLINIGEYTLWEYYVGPGEGRLHAEWENKPHRLVYDLVRFIVENNLNFEKEK